MPPNFYFYALKLGNYDAAKIEALQYTADLQYGQ